MPAKTREIRVVPGVLQWARKTIGKTVGEAARRLDLSENIVLRWESGEKGLTLNQLKELAKFYKRPLAAFFLPSPPEEPPLPDDFRSLPSNRRKPFSEKTLLAFRRARRLQSLAGSLREDSGLSSPIDTGKASLTDNIPDLASRVRERLQVAIDAQVAWGNENVALAQWKAAVERCGVLVFELAFPIEEGRAFSLADVSPPAIVLNGTDAFNGRIFSLFHEYGHLLLGHGGTCDWTETAKDSERFCNRFAAEFLVPEPALISRIADAGLEKVSHWMDETLAGLAKEFKVSREVILGRLLALGRCSQDFYSRKRDSWQAEAPDRRKRPWGKAVPAKQCIRQNGVPFTAMVLESAQQDKITYADVADYLSIRLKHLDAVESLVRAERARHG